jgi:glycerol-3-phosphate dehydrogenase subunit B
VVRPGERVGVPALLGLQEHTRLWQELEERLATAVFEIPTLPPSVPGLRLYQALRAQLQRRQVRIEIGMEAINFTAQAGQILDVQTATSARPRSHRAANYLLATGGFLGGGFNSDHTGRCWEVIFDLPLTTPEDRSQWFRSGFLDLAGQPIFQTGVAVNDDWQPVAAGGNMVYGNLWAAGGVLAHTDPIRERSLEGVAVATGIAAAQAILRTQGAPIS